jgi:hypothetical protein
MESIKRKEATSLRKAPIYHANYQQSGDKVFFHAQEAQNKKGQPIKDLDKLSPHGQSCVYILCDKDTKPLYVGITDHLSSRVSQHKSTKHWWEEVANIIVYTCDKSIQSRVEKETIEWLNPPHNKTNKPKNESFLAPNFIKLENMDFRFFVELNKNGFRTNSEPFLSEITAEDIVRRNTDKMLERHRELTERANKARERVHNFQKQENVIAHGNNPNKDSPILISNFKRGTKHKAWKMAEMNIKKWYEYKFSTSKAKEVARMNFKQKREYVEKNAKSCFVREYMKHQHYEAFCCGRLDAFDQEIDKEIQLRLRNAKRAGYNDVTLQDVLDTYI